ncbi:hypothetical protein CFAM422_009308 [Trichoderma lentiforme]|uniref:Uncharacterized protein n=1 Tax=Trichoderma lentiforme TaxID=1567552 RepID=A0A9P4XA36_9HYPO|nr:hypothetical protein CFAM422_009308 [Trichoderma lentiforme]
MFAGRKHTYTDQSSTAGGHPDENGLSSPFTTFFFFSVHHSRTGKSHDARLAKRAAPKAAAAPADNGAKNGRPAKKMRVDEDCDKAAEPTTPCRTARSMYCVLGDRVLFLLLEHIE